MRSIRTHSADSADPAGSADSTEPTQPAAPGRARRALPKALVAVALPLALMTGGTAGAVASPVGDGDRPGAGQAQTSDQNGAAPSAGYRFSADQGRFLTKAGTAPKALRHIRGTATDFTVLKGTGADGPTLAGTTLAGSTDSTSARAAWAANDEFVDLSWPGVTGAAPYQVFRDGELIATTRGTSLRDTQARPGAASEYRVTTTAKAPASEWTDSERAAFRKSGEAPLNGHTWSLNVQVPTDSQPAALERAALAAEAKAKKYHSTTIRYRTFIRSKWVTAPVGCKYTKGYKYAGDNRGFSKADSKSHRTDLTGTVYWNGGSSWGAHIGTTHVYKTNGKFVAKKTASKKKMSFRVMSQNSKSAQVRGITEAGNPYCGVGSISGYYNARISRSGDFYISGRHKRMPDHEIIISGFTRSPMKTYTKFLHTSKQASPACLFKPACPAATIGNNGGY
ncbi:hypothetical protein [Streptomyces buecherae]|uniref:hypothetical protein n=1 Tax=Streptomyces buecherae TaxID=2763006 RepID=UPI0037B85AC1